MSDINVYFLHGYAYVMPFKTKKTLDDILVIEDLDLIGTNFYQRVEILTPFNYE